MSPRRTWSAAACLLAAIATLTAAEPPSENPLDWQVVGHPVKSARVWTQALGSRPDGGIDFITQCWNYEYGKSGKDDIPEWLIVDLETGDTKRMRAPGYANTAHGLTNTLRAPNGRVFFAALGMQVYVYEPSQRELKLVTKASDEKSGYKFFYRCVIGADGNFYGATQSSNGKVGVIRIDSETLESQFYEDLTNRTREEGLTYGYYLAADPPWVYVAEGKGKWNLIALNVETDERRILLEDADWISFNERPEASIAKIKYPEGHDPALATFWCIDGSLTPVKTGAEPPVKAGQSRAERFAEIKKPQEPLVTVELTGPSPDGELVLNWRRHRTIKTQTTRFTTNTTEPIALESLSLLPDGSLLGNAKQYQGFFRYFPSEGEAEGRIEAFGPHGPSRPVGATVNGKLYFSGYPNGITYVYDPELPWSTQPGREVPGPADSNPRALTYLGGTNSGAHYAYFLIPANNGRIYFGGRRERGQTGFGIAWFDPQTLEISSNHDQLQELKPRGMAVLESLEAVVVSGMLYDDGSKTGSATQAELVVLDLDLREKKRIQIKPGLTNTGWLYPLAEAGQVLGCINDPSMQALYRVDVESGQVLQWKDLAEGISVQQIFQRDADDSWWALLGDRTLCRLDPATLSLEPVGTLLESITNPLWRQGEIWGLAGTQLVRIAVPTDG